MDFSTYLDQTAEAYVAPVYPPPACWEKMSSKEVLSALRGLRARPGRTMLKLALPFCRSKCAFCGLSVCPDEALLDGYLRAILREMRLLKGSFAGRGFFSFRVEGNAFSLGAPQLERVLAAASAAFKLLPGHKSGIELNPSSVTGEKAKLAAGCGIEWAILGVQSRDPAVLSAAGCAHSGTDLEKKYGILRDSGFRSVSMDLMFGLPQQTTESFIRDVLALVKMRPERIALYRCSRFKKSKSELDYVINKGFEIMERAGYVFQKAHAPYWGVLDDKCDERWPHAYETGNPVDAYSILSLGLGARSYILGRARYQNTKDVQSYIDGLGASRLPVETGCGMSARDEMAGYMLLSFDCLRVIRLEDFKSRFGADLEAVFAGEMKSLCKARVVRPCAAGYELLLPHDAARHAARKAFFAPGLIKLLDKKKTWITTTTY